MSDFVRKDGRATNQLREVTITRNWLENGEGNVLVSFGRTRVLCVASFTEGVPRWKKDSGEGWVTAEYAGLARSVLPASLCVAKWVGAPTRFLD